MKQIEFNCIKQRIVAKVASQDDARTLAREVERLRQALCDAQALTREPDVIALIGEALE